MSAGTWQVDCRMSIRTGWACFLANPSSTWYTLGCMSLGVENYRVDRSEYRKTDSLHAIQFKLSVPLGVGSGVDNIKIIEIGLFKIPVNFLSP